MTLVLIAGVIFLLKIEVMTLERYKNKTENHNKGSAERSEICQPFSCRNGQGY